MSVACAQQIISAIDIISNTKIGQQKLKQIHENSIFLRQSLVDLGFEVIGEIGSPVICIMIYYPSKVAAFSRECLKRGVAVVVVGAPATDLISSRCRICLSSSLTREDLNYAIKVIDLIGTMCSLKYNKTNVKK